MNSVSLCFFARRLRFAIIIASAHFTHTQMLREENRTKKWKDWWDNKENYAIFSEWSHCVVLTAALFVDIVETNDAIVATKCHINFQLEYDEHCLPVDTWHWVKLERCTNYWSTAATTLDATLGADTIVEMSNGAAIVCKLPSPQTWNR